MKLLALVVALLAYDLRPAEACATAPPEGAVVRVAEEEAIIAWDPTTGTEHFIRRASFSSTAKAFGFLVPTPTTPELGEVPDRVFWALGELTRPEVRRESSGFEVRVGSWLFGSCMERKGGDAKDTASAPAAVRVIQTAFVAGFEATTVEADNAQALTAWLAEHSFATTPELTAWLERYVTDKWKITAFVVASQQSNSANYSVATRAVRMSFKTDQPFYPYREPATKEEPAKDRLLRVFVLSAKRYAALLGKDPWSAKVLFAAPITVPVPLQKFAGETTTATMFVDEGVRRGIDELYFAISPTQEVLKQPAIVVTAPQEIVIPLDAFILLAIIALLVIRRRWRRARVHEPRS